jgi:transposase
MTGGVWREIVYDNMRNVVSRFIGRSEKALNSDLVKMSIYYGFSINVTNCFSGNEKGYVESAVKWIRNKVFATRYVFDTLDDARSYMEQRLMELNVQSRIEEERHCLHL